MQTMLLLAVTRFHPLLSLLLILFGKSARNLLLVVVYPVLVLRRRVPGLYVSHPLIRGCEWEEAASE